MINLVYLSRMFLTFFILVEIKAEEIAILLNDIGIDVADYNHHEMS